LTRAITASVVIGALVFPTSARGDDAITLDGISALVGGKSESAFDATPLLLSHLVLEARLYRTLQGRLAPKPPTHEELNLTRRIAVIVRLLAQDARRRGEAANAETREALEALLTRRVGGPEAVDRLLSDYGSDRTYLRAWLDSLLLAGSRLHEEATQLDAPSAAAVREILAAQGIPPRQMTPAKRAEARRLAIASKLIAKLATALESALATGRFQVLR